MSARDSGGRAVSPTNSVHSTRSSTRSAPTSTSNLESTITRLLVATKQLLEGLAKWSRGEVNEEAISAIYVKLGNDFNVACAAFAKENISMNELLSVPSDLRICLETCLSDTPSQSTLERHLPQVRQIIIGLLHGLREKQRLYRDGVAQRRAREKAAGSASGGVSPPQQALPNTSGVPLTPNSAGRSRDELRRFVTQAQQVAPGHDEPSAPLPRVRHSDGSAATSSTASTSGSSRRAASEVGATGAGGENSRLSAALSSRSSTSRRAGSLRDSDGRDGSNRSSRSTLEDIGFMPPPATSSSHPPLPQPALPRTNSGGSLSSISSQRASSRRQSPPPQSRPRDERPRTPTTDTYSVLPPSVPPPTIPIPSTVVRPPSIASMHSSSSTELAQQPFAPPPTNPNFNSFHHHTPLSAPQNTSLEALKTQDHLSRRASKRYSAYAIQKMTSPQPGGSSSSSTREAPSSPGDSGGSPSQDRGIKSRDFGSGSELRRSKSERQSTRGALGVAGGRAPPVPGIPRSWSSQQNLRGATGSSRSPILEQEEDEDSGISSPGLTRSPPTFAPPPAPPASHAVPRSGSAPSLGSSTSAPPANSLRPADLPPRAPSPALPPLPPASITSSAASSPLEPPVVSTTPFRIFLRLGPSVRRAQLPSPGPPADVQVLRQLFVERFGYVPNVNEGWPEVYVQDERTGVRYELEEMEEVGEGTVVCLNVDAVEQVKNHIDTGLSSLAQDIKELRATVTAMRRLSIGPPAGLSSPSTGREASGPFLSPDISSNGMRPSPSQKQFETAAERVLSMRKKLGTPRQSEEDGEDAQVEDLDGVKSAPSPAPPPLTSTTSAEPFSPTTATSLGPIVNTLKSQHVEVQNLRREIGILRQVYVDFTAQTKSMFASVRVQTSHLHGLAQSKLSTDRAFVEAGTAKLDSESTDLVVCVDELQDTIEQLRADTVRGVKPRPQQLSETASALRKATEQRQKLDQWMKEVKPSWSQMWSVELSKILSEQKTVETQETLLGELDEDLQDVDKVLKNIQAVAKQLKPSSSSSTSSGAPSRAHLRDIGGASGASADLSTVLLEVKALNPDPTRRLEAIERAEREREKQLASKTDEFADELGDFVGTGKLKKTGGIEEAERLRQKRSEAALKAMFSQ